MTRHAQEKLIFNYHGIETITRAPFMLLTDVDVNDREIRLLRLGNRSLWYGHVVNGEGRVSTKLATAMLAASRPPFAYFLQTLAGESVGAAYMRCALRLRFMRPGDVVLFASEPGTPAFKVASSIYNYSTCLRGCKLHDFPDELAGLAFQPVHNALTLRNAVTLFEPTAASPGVVFGDMLGRLNHMFLAEPVQLHMLKARYWTVGLAPEWNQSPGESSESLTIGADAIAADGVPLRFARAEDEFSTYPLSELRATPYGDLPRRPRVRRVYNGYVRVSSRQEALAFAGVVESLAAPAAGMKFAVSVRIDDDKEAMSCVELLARQNVKVVRASSNEEDADVMDRARWTMLVSDSVSENGRVAADSLARATPLLVPGGVGVPDFVTRDVAVMGRDNVFAAMADADRLNEQHRAVTRDFCEKRSIGAARAQQALENAIREDLAQRGFTLPERSAAKIDNGLLGSGASCTVQLWTVGRRNYR